MNIFVGLTVQRPAVKRVIGANLEDVRREVAKALTDRIMGRADNEAVMLVPSMVIAQVGERRGRWGEDEPHPDSYLPPEPTIGPPPSSTHG